MKIMSIIGIVWFSLSLICIFAFYETDLLASAGWGMLGLFYALPFAITSLIKSNKRQDKEKNITQELIAMHELKEKGILSEDEFQTKKSELLKM